MKKDEFLYEIMDEVTVEEAEMLDRLVAREEKSFFGCLGRKEKKEWKKMKSLTMDKINGQMKEERISKVSLFGRRRMVLLAAVLVMMLGIATVAKEKDWDIEMAERIGFSGAMENLEGGYVRIDKSVTKDDITITAVQSIGSQNCQWIQFDTNVPWETGEEGYYVFEDMSIDITTKRGKNIGYGAGLYSYDNNGYVSFMLDVSGYEKINRANMHISLGRLKQYENEYLEGGILLSEGLWEFEWKNYYAANTITKHPYAVVDNLLIYKTELSPISIHLEAVGLPSQEHDYLTVESVTLQDGTTVACQEATNHGCTNKTFYHNLNLFEQSIDLEKIQSVTVNGKEITLR